MTTQHPPQDHPRQAGRHRAAGRNGGRASSRRRTVAACLSVLLVAGLAVVTPATVGMTAASASPGTPGTPQSPATIYAESFENGTGTAQTLLSSYTGAAPTNETYTAANVWLTACNGEIVEFDTPYTDLGNCANTTDTSNTRQLAYALGVHGGAASPATNHAVTAYTEGNPGANQIEFATQTAIPLATAAGRYLTFSVDTAAVNCSASAPLYQFSLMNGTTPTAVGGQINACTSQQSVDVPADGTLAARAVNVGTYTANGAVLFTGSSLGIRMTNANGSGVGNDAAFDNVKVLDVTPQLDKSFSPATIETGQTSKLTFTVTNTSELAAKNGWSFTDTLPAGVTLAGPTAAATTCPSGAVTAAANGTSVKVTGNLGAGMASCTATVDVTSNTAGSYTNGPGNVTATGLNPPGDTTLTVTDPPAWTCNTFGYLFQSPNIQSPPHQIYQIDLVTGASSVAQTTADNINAVGYNLKDDYVYGWGAAGLTRIGADGSETVLGVPAGVTGSFNVGDFDSAGHMWIANSTTRQWYEIDLVPGSATYGKVLAQGVTNLPAGLSALPADWAYINGALYGATPTASGTGPTHLVSFNATTHVTTDLGPLPGTDSAAGGYGGAYADAAGNLYVSQNATGNIYRVKPATRATILLSKGPPSGNNDGERCATAPIPTVTVTKNVAGRVQAADQFTVGLARTGTTLTSATTAGTATTVSTDDWPVSANTDYTITDAMAAGSPDALTAYDAAIVCTDTTTGNPVATTGSGPNWTVRSTDADPITCTVTNTPTTASFTVTKTASTSGPVHPGDTVTYTVKVANTSSAPYLASDPASFTDSLARVLDDATYNGDATNGATVSGSTLTWSGALAPRGTAGDTVTITYSVTVKNPDTGDHTLSNAVVTPPGTGGNCATGSTDPGCSPPDILVQSFRVVKTTTSTTVTPGSTIDYTITVTNTGGVAYPAGAPASFTDDLSSVLDDATYNNDAAGGAIYGAPTLSWSGPLAVGETVTITYSVTVNTPDGGDQHLDNAALTPPNTGGNCATGSADPACSTHLPSRAFRVVKTSSAQTAAPGDKVTYTVTVTNTGATDYTAGDPASFSDDLSGVLDDAAYGNDASATAGTVSFSSPTLAWSGALAVGATVTVTYTATVTRPDTGDLHLSNVVTSPPGTGSTCVPGNSDPSCTTDTPVRAYTVTKTASEAAANPGDTVTYTVTVTNTGAVAYSAADPAGFTDDLTAVLDDATYRGDATSGATYAAPTLSWSGALPVGATVTVTYSVRVNVPDTGDGTLTNAAAPTTPGGACADGSAAPCAPTVVPVRSFTATKTADAAGPVRPGDTVTYTVTVTNTGDAAYTAAHPASFTDDLSSVVDDAAYNGDATSGATYSAPTLSWSGPLAVGQTLTVTYSVTVNDPDTGDDHLDNTVVTPPGSGGNCATASPDQSCSPPDIPVQAFEVTKTPSATSARPGDTVVYTITVTNTGAADYTAAAPASFTDNLSKVVDDATYNGDATGGATYAAPVLSWSGALAVGATTTITYSVTVDDPDAGDHELDNAAVTPPGSGGSCAAGSTDVACAPPAVPVQSFRIVKSADRTRVTPGQKVTYTVTVVNTGKVDYSAKDPASFTDDLSSVLDDSTYNNDATSGATYAAPTLSWSGALAVGATVTVTYSVTVDNPDTGDKKMNNTVVTPPDSGGNCATGSTDPSCTAQVPGTQLDVTKTASATTAEPGQKITYTITVRNTGQVNFTAGNPATFTDDLSRVLDDASYDNDASNGAAVSGTSLSWSGPLAVGDTLTVTYSVRVNSPDTGDKLLDNTVTLPAGENSRCTAGSTDPACSTRTPVADYAVKKVASATRVAPGDTVSYTITVTNTGQVDLTAADPATFRDDLTEVLDDATYDNDATGGAAYAAPILSWSGALAVGGTASVTYSVTVKRPDAGDGRLHNVVTTPNDPSGAPIGNCPADATSPTCFTDSGVGGVAATRPPGALANTGNDTRLELLLAGLLLAAGSLTLVAGRGRRRRTR